ncbi:hypothetical protein HII31_09409 [Pseudocercospora fuligena]|uniref:Myb-like domain-containing protein n=1 Tax=Pseudocercospora fuligena TaxID=685502 RepID=A0A8H6RAY9_9PEZI|nr:hypothetical protein HII31_09409 [Pseudocercospora fuligena]
MPMKWTAEQDQKLLMLIIDTVKPDFKTIATAWDKRYPGEEPPTVKALTEHVSKLKRVAKAANGGQAVSTPTSNKKRAAPKTPSSSAKRAKATAMSDEDDSEDEKKLDFSTPASKRESASRRSKANKSYAESDEDEDDGLSVPHASTQPEKHIVNGKGSATNSSSESNGARSVAIDSVLDTNGDLANHGPTARSKKSPIKQDYLSMLGGDDSDGDYAVL